ncbi:MAG: AAA family ATPase [Bradymonadales bacterium]|nr:AAA family ATPase [Bradymonadales bacterium]
MLEFSEQLFSLLASPYPYIQIRTFEEERVMGTLRALASAMNRPLVEWAPDDLPRGGLDLFLQKAPEQPPRSLLVLKDPHPYLDTPFILRKLKELEPILTDLGSVMILVSPYIDLPVELVKAVTYLEFPLPGRVELNTLWEEVFATPMAEEVSRDRLVAAAMGLTLKEARRAFHRARFELVQARKKGMADFDLEAAVVREKRRLIEVDRVLEFCDLHLGLASVGGMESLKVWLKERELAFSPQAASFGLPTPKGLLLTGVQGCGKSLFAKAIAGFWGIPLLRLDVGRLFEGLVPPESALQRAIHTAEALAPAVLWVDEIDKGFGDVAHSTSSRLMGSLLNWLQDKTRPVFVAATANQVQVLPPELLRKGRFDEIFFVDLPDASEREEILRIHLDRYGRPAARYPLQTLIEQSDHFSGAELEQVVVAGLYKAFARNRELELVDLEAAMAETVPLYRTCEDEIKGLRQWAQGRARAASRDRRLLDLFRQDDRQP